MLFCLLDAAWFLFPRLLKQSRTPQAPFITPYTPVYITLTPTYIPVSHPLANNYTPVSHPLAPWLGENKLNKKEDKCIHYISMEEKSENFHFPEWCGQ